MTEKRPEPFTRTPDGDVVFGKVTHTVGSIPPEGAVPPVADKAKPVFNIKGGITAGGRIVSGDQTTVNGVVVSEGEAPVVPEGYSEGTKFIGMKIEGEISDRNGKWQLLKVGGKPVQNDNGEYVYVPVK